MRVTRTTMGKRTVTTTLVEQEDYRFNSGAGNPTIFDHPVHVNIGDDSDNRRVELLLTLTEAKRLIESLTSAVQRVEALFTSNDQQ